MESSIERVKPYITRITVTIPAEDVDKAVRPLVEKYNKKGTIKGFRPGKAPASQIIARFGPAISAELFDGLVSKSVLQAIKESKVDALGTPTVDESSELKMGQPLIVKAFFYARDEIALPDFSGLKLVIADPEPDEKAVKEALDDYRKRLATLTEAEPDYEIKAGDLVSFVTLYHHEGRYYPVRHLENPNASDLSEEELSKEEDSDLKTVEAGISDPNSKVSMEMVGRKIGDFIDIPLHVDPESELHKHLAEKELLGRLGIRKISIVSLPDLDDDLVQTLSIPRVGNVEEFTGFVRHSVRSRRESFAESMVQGQIINFISQNLELPDLPKPILEAEIDNQMLGHKPMDRESMKKTGEEWLRENYAQREQFRGLGLKSIKVTFAAEQIAENQSLAPSNEEVEARTEMMLASHPRGHKVGPEELEAYRDTARNVLTRERAFGWIKEQAQKSVLPFEEAFEVYQSLESKTGIDLDYTADQEDDVEVDDLLAAAASETVKLVSPSEEEAAESLKAQRDMLRAERKAKEEAQG
ncbi:MAG: hypothetical protein LBE49_07250 [Deltaproteobacteria bacterium]|jgi:trigger factor|nr:hypothetical protein [Deltaproteobacteria bacterium]